MIPKEGSCHARSRHLKRCNGKTVTRTHASYPCELSSRVASSTEAEPNLTLAVRLIRRDSILTSPALNFRIDPRNLKFKQ